MVLIRPKRLVSHSFRICRFRHLVEFEPLFKIVLELKKFVEFNMSILPSRLVFEHCSQIFSETSLEGTLFANKSLMRCQLLTTN